MERVSRTFHKTKEMLKGLESKTNIFIMSTILAAASFSRGMAADEDPFGELTTLGDNAMESAGTFIKLAAVILYAVIVIGVPLITLFSAKKKAEQKGADNPWVSAAVWASVAFFVSIIALLFIEKMLGTKYQVLAPSKIIADLLK